MDERNQQTPKAPSRFRDPVWREFGFRVVFRVLSALRDSIGCHLDATIHRLATRVDASTCDTMSRDIVDGVPYGTADAVVWRSHLPHPLDDSRPVVQFHSSISDGESTPMVPRTERTDAELCRKSRLIGAAAQFDRTKCSFILSYCTKKWARQTSLIARFILH